MNGLDIEAIRAKCREGAIRWSAHSAARMLQRGITREDVVNCVMNGEVIEQYPEHWLNPACLIFGLDVSGMALHVVVGMNDFAHIVTAYRPESSTFMPDMKTRKEN